MGSSDQIEMAYISKCACGCGAVTFATVDKPEWAKDTAKTIAKLIREGRAVERMSLGAFRMEFCKRRQGELLNTPAV